MKNVSFELLVAFSISQMELAIQDSIFLPCINDDDKKLT